MFDGIKNKLKEAGLVEDAPAPAVEEDAAPEPVATPVARRVSTPRPTVATSVRRPVIHETVVTPTADPEIVATLQDATEKSKMNGYPEFKAMVDALDAVDEDQRIPAAVKALEKREKITPSQILDSIDDRLSILDSESADFERSYQEQVAKEVEGGKKQIEDIVAEVAAKKAEIADLEAQRVTLVQSVGARQVELEQNRATFTVSLETVRAALQSEREVIQQFNIVAK